MQSLKQANCSAKEQHFEDQSGTACISKNSFSEVFVVQLDLNGEAPNKSHPSLTTFPAVLTQKRFARKFYLSMTLEDEQGPEAAGLFS